MFCVSYVNFEMPIRHSNGDMKYAAEHMSLEFRRKALARDTI